MDLIVNPSFRQTFGIRRSLDDGGPLVKLLKQKTSSTLSRVVALIVVMLYIRGMLSFFVLTPSSKKYPSY